MPPSDPRARRLVYGLLITIAAGLAAGRIASVERLHEPSVHKAPGSDAPRPGWPRNRPEPSPTFSSNDRSRWAAARALVENGTFVVGKRHLPAAQAYAPAILDGGDPLRTFILLEAGYRARTRSDTGIIFEEGFGSVDKVLKPDTDEFYSTKPPLLTLLMAGEYWALKAAFGWTMAEPADATSQDKSRVNENRFHVVRVALVLFDLIPFVLYLAVLAWLAERFGEDDWSRYFVVAAGAFATLVWPFLVTINNHTLATTFVAVLMYAVVRIREVKASIGMTLLGGFAAGMAVCLELPALALVAGVCVYVTWCDVRRAPLFLVAALVPVAVSGYANYLQLGELAPAYDKFGGPWYQYEGSHWLPAGLTKKGIDYARRNGETIPTYAFHLLLGHHGIFSLTPVMLLAVVGMAMGVWRLAKRRELPALLGAYSLLVSLVVVGFYVRHESGNYGGWSNGPRWLMWLSPLWLVAMLPALGALARSRWGRLLALALLALSILSMNYQSWNPWRHPWIYNWMESRGWIGY